MTLPERITLPPYALRESDPNQYFQDLTKTVEDMYFDVVDVVNGSYRRNVDPGRENWTPILKDTANAGTTFTYDHQVGWVLRQGLQVDCWFDIEWTANTGAITGNMYVELPYLVALTDEMPFVGVIQPSVFAFTGGTECVINAISDTYRGEIWNTGSAFTTANQGSVAAGHLIGHIRYIGQTNE